MALESGSGTSLFGAAAFAFLAGLPFMTAVPAGGAAAQQAPAAEVMTEPARQCLQDLRTFKRRLIDIGYGLAGPDGYGVSNVRGIYGRYGSPRGEMGALIDAAHIFALSGMGQSCRDVLDGAEQLYERRFQTPGEDAPVGADFRAWRLKWLAASIPATEWKGEINLARLRDADVRNIRDEDLGDVADLVISDGGAIRYVLVERGGFLGIGDKMVPVPWAHVRITPRPYVDTLVIPADEATMEQAPSLARQAIDRAALAEEEIRQQLDAYWRKAAPPQP